MIKLTVFEENILAIVGSIWTYGSLYLFEMCIETGLLIIVCNYCVSNTFFYVMYYYNDKYTTVFVCYEIKYLY